MARKEKEVKGLLDCSIRFGDVSCSRGDGYISLEIEDLKSGITFLEIKLTPEQFGRAIGSNGSVPCKVEVRGLEYIGKKYEHRPGKATIDKATYDALTCGVEYASQKSALSDWIKANCQEDGWHISAYLGSRDSIVYREDGGKDLNFTYYRYTEEGQEVESV